MRLIAFVAPVLLVHLVAVNAFGQEAERYRLEKTADGYVRMDTSSGEMSVCTERTGQLVCRAAADERAAFHDEIERLQGALDALEKRVAALEAKPETPGLLSEQELDRTMGVMKKFFEGFMGIVKDLDRDLRDEPQGGLPQRT